MLMDLIGQYSLLLALLFSLITIFLSNNIRFNYILSSLAFLSLTFSFSTLIYLLIMCNPNNINALILTNENLPIFYRVGSAWGSHEGSMLLWCYIISIYQIYSLVSQKLVTKSKNFNNQVLSASLTIFLFYVYTSSNPFLLVYTQSWHDSELNPILQDPILVIHPPIIYLGYLGSCVIYANIITYIKYKYTYLIKEIRRIALYGWAFLTLGILLGSWWSYHELGWGGWWFWDPVENISLLPWIFYIVLIHNISSLNKQSHLTRVGYLFSLMVFISSCYGTFFVRSGFITSVHSFVNDSHRGILILISLALFIVLFLFYYIKNCYNITQNSNYLVYIYNSVFLLIIIMIFFGTIFPAIYLLLTQKEISIGVTFYNNIIVPWAIVMLLLMLYSSLSGWRFTYRDAYFLFLYNVIILGLYFYYIYDSEINYGYTVIILLSYLNILNSIYSMFRYKTINHKNISHMGISVCILGMVLSNHFEYEAILNSYPGDSFMLEDNLVIIRDINIFDLTSYYSLYANILIDNGISEVISFPEKRLYLLNSSVTSKSSIISNFMNDIYCLIGDGNYQDGWYIRVYLSKYINLIWIGGVITVSTFFLNKR